jgi:hypothetical protein
MRCDEGRGRGGLGDHGHAREQRLRGLLREAPRGEVERVDVHRHARGAARARAAPRGATAAAEVHRVAVDEVAASPSDCAELGVGLEGPNGAVDVELRVAAGVAAVAHREVEQLVALRVDRRREGLQHLAHAPPKVIARRAGPPLVAGEGERRVEVDTLGAGLGEGLLGRRG